MNDIAVSVNNLYVQFGEHIAVENASLTVPVSSFTALIGPNGSGKSTFLKTLLGLIKPTKGQATIFGRKPNDVPPQWIGYVPQIKTLDRTFPALAIELVSTGITQSWLFRVGSTTEKAMDALRQVGGEHLAYKPIASLSGGELQRIYLARSLAREPKLLILDEPATGIDAVGEKDMYHALDEYHQNTTTTILMVTHDWGAAFHHADQAIIMNRKIIAYGSPLVVMTDANMRFAFGHRGHEHTMALERHDV